MSSIKNLLKALLMAFLVILAPFIYPIVLKILIKYNIFNSLDEYNVFMATFSNKYTLISLLIILTVSFPLITEGISAIKDILTNIELKFKFGDKEINLTPAKELFEKTKITDKLEKTKKLVKENFEHNKTIDYNKDEINELMETIKNIKFFSAYNNTNSITKELLLRLIKEKNMQKKDFVEELRKYYNRKIKNVFGKKKENCINRNIEEKIFNYNYLEIIEISEDDENIILTSIGEEFVQKYLE